MPARERGRTTRWWNRENGASLLASVVRRRFTSTWPSSAMTPVTIIRFVGSSIPNQAASTLDMGVLLAIVLLRLRILHIRLTLDRPLARLLARWGWPKQL